MKRREAYRGRSFSMFVEEVELPNGRSVELDILRHPGAAAVVPFMGDDRVLLIHQYRHAAGGSIWEVPAGKLDDGEDPAVCAARELEEETGHVADRFVRLGAIWTTPGFTDERIHLFAAFGLRPGEQRLEDAEVIEVVPTPFATALERVWSGEISDSKSAMALVLAARHLGRLAFGEPAPDPA